MRMPTKLQMVKTLVLPYLFYPPVPLHLASKTQMRKLQRVQNNSLRFAYGVKWDEYVSSKRLHNEYRPAARPVNQVLYWRARDIWEGIKNDISGNASMLEKILKVEIDYSSRREKDLIKFPSSYTRAMKRGEPPPYYG